MGTRAVAHVEAVDRERQMMADGLKGAVPLMALPFFQFQIDGRKSILVLRHRYWNVGSPFVFAVGDLAMPWWWCAAL
jgi:hypothetical protein